MTSSPACYSCTCVYINMYFFFVFFFMQTVFFLPAVMIASACTCITAHFSLFSSLSPSFPLSLSLSPSPSLPLSFPLPPYSPVDVYFASCSHDTTARLWVTDLAYPLRIFAGHTSGVNVSWNKREGERRKRGREGGRRQVC